MLRAALDRSVLPRCQGTHATGAAPSHWALAWVSTESASPPWKSSPIFKALEHPLQPTPPASGSPCLSQWYPGLRLSPCLVPDIPLPRLLSPLREVHGSPTALTADSCTKRPVLLLCIFRLQVSRHPNLCEGALHPLPSASSAPSWVGQGLLCLRGLKKARLGLPHSLAYLRLSSSSSSFSMGTHQTDCPARLLPNLASHISEFTGVSAASFRSFLHSTLLARVLGVSRVPEQGGAPGELGGPRGPADTGVSQYEAVWPGAGPKAGTSGCGGGREKAWGRPAVLVPPPS